MASMRLPTFAAATAFALVLVMVGCLEMEVHAIEDEMAPMPAMAAAAGSAFPSSVAFALNSVFSILLCIFGV